MYFPKYHLAKFSSLAQSEQNYGQLIENMLGRSDARAAHRTVMPFRQSVPLLANAEFSPSLAEGSGSPVW